LIVPWNHSLATFTPDFLTHSIQREILESVFGVFGKEKIKGFKRHFRLIHTLQSQEVDEQFELAIVNLRQYFRDRKIEASDIEFD